MTIRAQLNHLGLYTPQMERMERFYVDVMGLIVTDRGRVPRLGNVEIVFMSANPASHHQVAIIGKPDQTGTSCVNQIAFKVETLEELRALHLRLGDAGTGAVQPIDHGNAWSVYAFDPDGNGVEVYLDTPWHVAQPHSRPLDFGLSNNEIAIRTEEAVRKDPTFSSLEHWRREMGKLL